MRASFQLRIQAELTESGGRVRGLGAVREMFGSGSGYVRERVCWWCGNGSGAVREGFGFGSGFERGWGVVSGAGREQAWTWIEDTGLMDYELRGIMD